MKLYNVDLPGSRAKITACLAVPQDIAQQETNELLLFDACACWPAPNHRFAIDWPKHTQERISCGKLCTRA